MNTEGGIGEKTKWGTSWGGHAQTVTREIDRGNARHGGQKRLCYIGCPAVCAGEPCGVKDFNFAVELLSLPKQIENRHGRIAATCSISNCGQIDSDFRQIEVGSSVLAAKTHGFEQISDVPLLFATRAGSGDALPRWFIKQVVRDAPALPMSAAAYEPTRAIVNSIHLRGLYD
jgi:hypothetical protein